ncbi:MAG: hypothetical protein WC538_22130 [Thermoanaerobaculia bacterium]
MAKFTRAEFNAAVRMSCGNWPASGHPVVDLGIIDKAVVNAANRLIRENPDHFPEHQDNSWTVGPTADGDDYIDLPSNMIMLDRVARNESSTDPATWVSVREQKVALQSMEVVSQLDRDDPPEQYPFIAARKGTILKYYPPTVTGKECYFRVWGLAGESDLSAAGSTFRLDERWDSAIVLLAASEVLESANQNDLAAEKYVQANERIKRLSGGSLVVMAREAARRPSAFRAWR